MSEFIESVTLNVFDQYAEIKIDKPETLNALNPDILHSIVLYLEKIEVNKNIRLVVISGKGEKAFVAGADIRCMYDLGRRAIADYVELGQRTMRCIENFHCPVIAKVDGYALGGGMELALACDIILASAKSKFGQPEVNLGIIPGFGGTQRLLTRCGVGMTKYLVYTGEIISAEKALAIGLVDQVFEDSVFNIKVQEFIEIIISKAPIALKNAKHVINQTQEQIILGGLNREVEGFLKVFQTVDREEGMEAFLQKRKPVFKGK